MQFLIAELAKEEDNHENLLSELQSHETYLIHSPYDCFEAAHKMNQMLAEYKKNKNAEFDVCFFTSQLSFEISLKQTNEN